MIRGTTHDQDARFSDKIKKMIEKSQWPDKYDIKIDLSKVDLQLMKAWIQKRLTSLLGEEDDVISGTIISIIDQHVEKQQKLLAKNFHVAISGFLLDKTLTFVSELWDLLDEAQRSSRGIPESLLQQKKKSEELQRRKIEELNSKRYKINSNKFNNVVKRFTNNRDQYPVRERQQRSQRQHKKKKNKDRSRSIEKKKKHRHSEQKRKYRSRSRSYERQKQRQRRHRQKQEHRHKRNKRSSSKQKHQQKPQKTQKSKRRSQTPSDRSESSDVISSSNSNGN